jgi:hypothetical protein
MKDDDETANPTYFACDVLCVSIAEKPKPDGPVNITMVSVKNRERAGQ